MDERAARLQSRILAETGTRDGEISWVRVPGRVNLIGDHTDYNEGFVLPMAIDRDCLIASVRRGDDHVRATSLELETSVEVASDGSADPRAVYPSWGRFIAGAVQALTVRGARVPGLELVLSSTVPLGAGLSSSSALSVGAVLTLADAAGLAPPPLDIARIALDAEVRATGVPGGLMDQLTALHGRADHALLIDCRSNAIEPLPLPRALSVVAIHSGMERTLAASAYPQRRAACEEAATALGLRALRDASLDAVRDNPIARHVVSENARVLEFADALRSGDTNALGPLMLSSHASLRDDFAVSTPELDLLVELAVECGAYGARLTGAGFGGCIVALAQRNHADDVAAKVALRYRAASRREPVVFSVRAVDGAGIPS